MWPIAASPTSARSLDSSNTCETRPISRSAVTRRPSETAMPGALLPPVLQGVHPEVGESGDVAARGADAEDAAHQRGSMASGRAFS